MTPPSAYSPHESRVPLTHGVPHGSEGVQIELHEVAHDMPARPQLDVGSNISRHGLEQSSVDKHVPWSRQRGRHSCGLNAPQLTTGSPKCVVSVHSASQP